MSLVITSSNWISGEQQKKRIPTIRKTVKKTTPITSTLDTDDYESTESMYINTIDDDIQNSRNSKVNEILEKMSSIKTNDDGDYLENFTPLSYPDQEPVTKDTILPSDYDNDTIKRRHVTNTNFTADTRANIQSDFNRVYEVSTNKPSYASSIGLGKDLNNDNKISERLSYIVHLLEQQQNEKTNYMFEECVLYVLLGTFVILIVDSFSRGGKYVR
jgi:hypothetical protein